MPRYIGRGTVDNNTDQYKDLFDDRGVDTITHYETLELNSPNYSAAYPSIEHIWKRGDKLFKLSYEYYGTYKHWWLIALYNNKPTDAHYTDGDSIDIPIDPVQIINDITE
jgi:hypothetical protein